MTTSKLSVLVLNLLDNGVNKNRQEEDTNSNLQNTTQKIKY